MKVLEALSISADNSHLDSVVEMVSRCAAPYFDKRTMSRLQLATEEAVVNVFQACKEMPEAMIHIRCMAETDKFIIEVRDPGPPFDPTQHQEPIAPGPRIGGYGIPLIKKIMDEVAYKYEEKHNILKMILRL